MYFSIHEMDNGYLCTFKEGRESFQSAQESWVEAIDWLYEKQRQVGNLPEE